MNFRFIDTSVMLNLLEVPEKCDRAQETINEFKKIIESGERIILPITAVIETGNHISHISNGNERRKTAQKFVKFIEMSINGEIGEAPWFFDRCELSKDDLRYIIKKFPDEAMRERGLGDLSIIRQYEVFKERMPAVGRIKIWSYDNHLQAYEEDLTSVTRRRGK